MSDWRDTRFHLTMLFCERVYAPLLLTFVAVVLVGALAWAAAAVL